MSNPAPPECYRAAAEQLSVGEAYISRDDGFLITATDIRPDATPPTGTVTFVPLSVPTKEHAKTVDAADFDDKVNHTGAYVRVSRSTLSRADEVLEEYIDHNLDIDKSQLGVAHPHSTASTVGDIVAARLVTDMAQEWPPEILDDCTDSPTDAN